MTEYWIEIFSAIPAKKNQKVPFKTKDGKVRFYNQNQDELDRIAMQVPAEVRDIGLLHPDIDFWFVMPDGRRDRDNSITTLLDILVRQGVLWNDNVTDSNGTITIHPATRGEIAKTTIKLTDTGADLWPRRKKPG